MAKVIDENIQRQLDKKISFFVKYYPARIQNVGEDAKAARQLVWAFKDSRDSAYEEVAQMTAKHLKEEYGEKVKSMVLVCVPTSKKENYQSRYMMFCNRVSELTGIGNGFSHVCVLQDRLDVHNHRRGKKRRNAKRNLLTWTLTISRTRRYVCLMMLSPQAKAMRILLTNWRIAEHTFWVACS